MNAVLVSILAIMAGDAQAQTRPMIEIVPISTEKRPKLALQRVGVGDCYGVTGSQREEIALIQITVRGPWERTAEHLAKEKAGEAGANCLYPLYSAGEDNSSYPVRRNYRALRVTVPAGAYRAPASPDAIAPMGKSASADLPSLSEFPKLKVPEIRAAESHNGHLGWALGSGVVSHEVTIDFGKTDAPMRADILKDIEEYFPENDYRRLSEAADRGGQSRVELPR